MSFGWSLPDESTFGALGHPASGHVATLPAR
jgi:hypothetical protein